MPRPLRALLSALLPLVLAVSAACTGQLVGSEGPPPADGAEGEDPPAAPDPDGGTARAPAPGTDGGPSEIAPPDAGGAPSADAGGSAPPPPTGTDAGVPVADGETASPNAYLPERVLLPTTVDGLYIYNPHTDRPYAHAGSGHTHCSPDHSGIAASTQESRLRDLDNGNAHDFVWMTAHDVVAADPSVSGMLHMFGSEIYTGTLPSGGSPHVLAFLPDGALAGRSDPFGPRYQPFGDTLQAVADAGGLPVLAHPARYSPSTAEVVDAPAALWGAEIVSGGTDPADNARWIDARLSAGKYLCLSAGGDIHDEDWSLTRGYQLVASRNAAPDRAELFAQVRACDFFACRVGSDSYAPLDGPRVAVEGGEIVVSAGETLDRVEFIGDGGRMLANASDTTSARYRLSGDETYVRVRAYRATGGAECFSQPLWLYRR